MENCNKEIQILQQITYNLGKHILSVLDELSISHDAISEKSKDFAAEAFLLWVNSIRKRVEICPRKVNISSELRKKMSSPDFAAETKLIEAFAAKMESGEDINGHLSKLIYATDKWDYLLNQWNIRHLHLCEVPANNKSEMSKNRSSLLLFFITTKTDAYFLDVRMHPKGSGFTAIDFLELAEHNGWIDLCGGMLREDIVRGSLQPTITSNDDIYLSYKNHINIMLEVNQKYYWFMGTSSFGNKFEDSISWNRLQNELLGAISEEMGQHHRIVRVNFDLHRGHIILISKNILDGNTSEITVPILLLGP